MQKVFVNKDEKGILQSQGTLKNMFQWKLGHLYLTDRRLFFVQSNKNIFQISLDEISALNIFKRTWLLGVSVKQLCIQYGKKHVYIALAKPEKWVDAINEYKTLMLAERWGCCGAEPEPPGDTE